MAQRVVLGPGYYPDPTIGRPVSNGDIYVGEVDLDPEIEANQQQISVLQENGTTTEVDQPIHTGAGGVPIYNGSPVTILVDADYSVKVLDSTGAQVYYVPSASALADGVVTLPKMADGTPGNLISYDAAGAPEAVATGTVGQILTSRGAGLPPTMQSVTDLVVQRSKFTFKDTDEIYLDGAAYLHAGTATQIVYWVSQLTYQFVSLVVSDWSYLYIDDSAVVAADTNVITATELIDSTTEPTWSDTKKGWYNGEDLCIFAVNTNGSSQIFEFWHGNEKVFFADESNDYGDVDVDLVWLNATLTLPSFCTMAQVTFKLDANGSPETALFWRTDGQTGSTGHEVCNVPDVVDFLVNNTVDVRTSTSQIIEVVTNRSGATSVTIFTNAWYFPIGM